MRTFILFLAAAIIASGTALGQSQPGIPKSNVETSQPQTGTDQKQTDKKVTRIKMNPLVILSGDMPVYLERQLNKNLSAEVSVGSTYDNVLNEVLENGNQPDLSMNKAGLNSYSFSAALRYYPAEQEKALEGYYFSPEVRFRDYRSQVTAIGGEPFKLKQSRQVVDGKFVVGYIAQTNSRIFFDFYGGIGMRYKFYNNRIENYAVIYDPATNQTTTQVKLGDEVRRGLLLSLGFKLGFAF